MRAYFRLIQRKFSAFDKQVFGVWGFKGIGDYVSTVLGLSIMPFFYLQLVVAGTSAWLIWISKWIWNPPFGAILIMSMTIINAFYESKVDKRIRKLPFSFKYFQTIEQIIELPAGFEPYTVDVTVTSSRIRGPVERSFPWKTGSQAAL